jgi:23S rRNA pseudouridine955/2504/2580 synthase
MREISITAGESSKKLENFLKKRFPIGYVRKLFRKNGVRLNGKRSKPNDLIVPGDSVQLYIPFEKRLKSARQSVALQGDLEIIFEDDEVIVINKPAGIAVHEGKDVQAHSILGMLEARCRRQGETPRLVHRLDKDTGVLWLPNAATATNSEEARSAVEKSIYVVGRTLQRNEGPSIFHCRAGRAFAR